MKLFKGKSGSMEITSKDQLDNKIIVLGACCNKSKESFENVKEAASILGMQEEAVNIGDYEIIASYGVLTTPALVINNKVYCQGKKISVEDAKKYLEKSLEE